MKSYKLRTLLLVKLCLMGVAYAGTMGMINKPNWTGFYLGATGGGGFGDPSLNMTYLQEGNVESGIVWYPTSVSQNFSGALFGGQVGYNYQFMPNAVIGLKYDIELAGWSAINASPSGDSTGSIATLSSTQKLNWFGHLLPRLGYLINDNVLIYGTGGLLYGNFEGSANQIFTTLITYPGHFKINSTGWSAGAGIELRKMANWSVAAEYLYNQFGNNTIIANEVLSNGTISTFYQNQYLFKNNFQTVALSVNYLFL